MILTADQVEAVAEAVTRALPDLIRQTLATHAATPPATIDTETRPFLPTPEAARLLGRRPQTLRVWACEGNGLLRPHRIGSRLMWSTAEIRALLAPKGSKTKAVSE